MTQTFLVSQKNRFMNPISFFPVSFFLPAYLHSFHLTSIIHCIISISFQFELNPFFFPSPSPSLLLLVPRVLPIPALWRGVTSVASIFAVSAFGRIGVLVGAWFFFREKETGCLG